MRDPERSYVHNIPAARRLRGRQTESEAVLWDALRNRRLDGLKFRRQHAIGRYVVDFYCDDARLAVEVDGGMHRAPEQLLRDRVRQSAIEDNEIAFVRVTDGDVMERLADVLESIAAAIRDRGTYSTASGGEGRCG